MIKKICILFFTCVVLLAGAGLLRAGDGGHKTVAYLFWGEGCPHCSHEKPFLEGLKTKYPGFAVKEYEVWHNTANKDVYEKMSSAYGVSSGSVPATFLGSRVWIGYNDEKAKEIEAALKECLRLGCVDPAEMMAGMPVAGRAPSVDPGIVTAQQAASADKIAVDLPLIGGVDAAKVSLPVLTLVLAGLDGFNPCAFFVLLMLLSLMVHAASRVRMLVVGGVFVFFSGFVYFLFMAAWLNLFMITGRVSMVTGAAGLLACAAAVINIKDYFFFKQGVSLTLSEKAQASLLARMRGLIKAGSMAGLVFGTIVLAVMANMYELLCTAGFPMVFTRALTLQKLSTAQYYLYLVFYNVIYVIPLLVIVVFFASTLGARKLTEQEGRVLKLVSGLMMLGLGGTLVFRPVLLNSPVWSAGLVGGVLALSALMVRLDRRRERSKGHGS